MKVMRRDLRYCGACLKTVEHKRTTLDALFRCVRCENIYAYPCKNFLLQAEPPKADDQLLSRTPVIHALDALVRAQAEEDATL